MTLRKEPEGTPRISQVQPPAAIVGGELAIRGTGLARLGRPAVKIGDVMAPIVIGSDSLVIVKVPEGAHSGDLIVDSNGHPSRVWSCDIGIGIAENLHPVTSPAVDSFGNIYTTFSGSRGQGSGRGLQDRSQLPYA